MAFLKFDVQVLGKTELTAFWRGEQAGACRI
jgi:hypothetical protein